MDTVLGEALVFKLFRASSAIGTMVPPAIVITLDIIKHSWVHYFLVGKVISHCALSKVNIECSWLAMFLMPCPSGPHSS
ncbi:hypothetical protein CU280_00950 [Yersinia mollaretii]|nr:hypothetical protein CU280_00950 [Yersinia mollaretii]